jgi:hypothetical protein
MSFFGFHECFSQQGLRVDWQNKVLGHNIEAGK